MTSQNEVQVNEVNLYPLRPNDKGLIAFASLLFANRLSLNSIAVYTKPLGDDIRLLFPTKKLPNGKEVSIFYPIDRGTYDLIKKAILEKLKEAEEKVIEMQ